MPGYAPGAFKENENTEVNGCAVTIYKSKCKSDEEIERDRLKLERSGFRYAGGSKAFDHYKKGIYLA